MEDHKGKRWVFKDGVWHADSKAAPQLLDESIRRLPGEIVTSDIADGDKIHPVDAPHVVREIHQEFLQKEAAGAPSKTLASALPKLPAPEVGQRVPLTQWFIDLFRMRLIQRKIANAVNLAQTGAPDFVVNAQLEIDHLWFPENNVNHVEHRQGIAPLDSKRPRHLRNFKLEVDVFNWPASMLDEMKAMGVHVDTPDMIAEMVLRAKRIREAVADLPEGQIVNG